MRKLDDLADIIRQAQKDLVDIKAKQYAGTTNIKVYENASANAWDINQNVTLSGLRTLAGYFIADTQLAPFAAFRAEIQLDNVPYNTITDTRLNDFDFGINKAFFTTLNPTLDQVKRLAYYEMNLTNATYPVTINVKVKFRVFATDAGTVGGFVI